MREMRSSLTELMVSEGQGGRGTGSKQRNAGSWQTAICVQGKSKEARGATSE